MNALRTHVEQGDRRRPMPSEETIEVLMQRAAAGDQAAWNEIVDRHTNLLWSIGRSYRLSTADVTDVIQTTWLRLLENLDRIREPERLPGWLATTARRECLRCLRSAGRTPVDWDGDELGRLPDSEAPALDEHLITSERDAALWQVFRRLPERCQHLLRVLMAAAPPAYVEISIALGLPVGSIGPTRMRCLRRLEGLIADSGYPFGTALEGS